MEEQSQVKPSVLHSAHPFQISDLSLPFPLLVFQSGYIKKLGRDVRKKTKGIPDPLPLGLL